MPEVIQERRKYNELIEDMDIRCAVDVRNIHTFRQTERAACVLSLFEQLYSDFDLLFILTRGLDKLKNKVPVSKAETWLKANRSLPRKTDEQTLQISLEGCDLFMDYHGMLLDHSIISLPGK